MLESTSAFQLKAQNVLLTQENIALRQKIASLRNERIQMNQKLVESIGAKESFKIEAIKLITNVQNTFERLKTFIEHTTSTPPTRAKSALSSRQRLLNGLTTENLKQLQHSEVIKQKSMSQQHDGKDVNVAQKVSTTTNENVIQKIEKENDSSLKVLNQISSSNVAPKASETTKTKARTPKKLNIVYDESRRCSKRLKSMPAPAMAMTESANSNQHEKQSNATRKKDNKENIEIVCPFKDRSNETQMRLLQAKNQAELVHSPVEFTPTTRGRKRRIIV